MSARDWAVDVRETVAKSINNKTSGIRRELDKCQSDWSSKSCSNRSRKRAFSSAKAGSMLRGPPLGGVLRNMGYENEIKQVFLFLF